MEFTTLHILFLLLTALSLTTQELVTLDVSPKVIAECGKQVTLSCKVSSSLEGLSIKHMEWSQNNSLCSVKDGKMSTNNNTTTQSDFHCEYENGQLSLIFPKVQPLETRHSSPYKCKLRSNKGVESASTNVELQECAGIATGVVTSHGPSCTFSHVYPDGRVHWFHGSRNLSDEPLTHHTSKQVEGQGFLTIYSQLEWKGSDLPLNCSLMSTKSGRYIASTLVQNHKFRVRSGTGSEGALRTVLYIPILLAVSLT
eukprot:superscaffoldBa00003894_g17907